MNNDFNDFVRDLDRLIEDISNFKDELRAQYHKSPESGQIAPELQDDYTSFREALATAINAIQVELSTYRELTSLKKTNLSKAPGLKELPSKETVAEALRDLNHAFKAINKIIRMHNDGIKKFNDRKIDAGIAIRKHFIHDCRADFQAHINQIELLEDSLKKLRSQITTSADTIEKLRARIRSHGPAADIINKLISSYLGHEELSIIAVKEGYEIRRYDERIHGLPSEGEKTAIAISYFLSTLEANDRNLSDLLVVIDDPVSSLDTRALNYACSLLRGRLSKAAQLIVLTHNQQCMNEFRKAWINQAKPKDKDKTPTATFLFIDVEYLQKKGCRVATLVEMPKLLREYDSEYHYIFQHVLKFQEADDLDYSYAYMLPNIMRRVLDVFLAFRFPGNNGLKGKLEHLCKEYPDIDSVRISVIERLCQVESHSDNIDDLISFSSMTLEETKDAADSLINMINKIDPNHLAKLKRLCR